MDTLLAEAKMEDIAERAAVKAVRDMLIQIGLDPNDSMKLQADFVALRTLMRDEETMADMLFLRDLRKKIQGASAKVGFAIISLFVIATGTLLALGFRAWLGIFPPPH